MKRVTTVPGRGDLIRAKDPVKLGAVLALVMVTLLAGRAGAEPDRQVLNGHVPPVIQRMNLHPIGDVPATNRIVLAIGLPLRNRPALDALLRQITDPSSPNYGHYLTPEQFTEQFGPTPQDFQALIGFAQANGFEITKQHPNRMLLDVKAAPADIEKAFQVKLHLYQHPTENRTFFAPDAEPSVPSGLSVIDISGLNNYGRPHPKFVYKPKGPTPDGGLRPNVGSGPGGTFLGYDFRDAYAPGVTLTGAGQTLILFEYDGFLASDIAEYDAQAGLPVVPIQTVLLGGFNGVPTGTGGEVEVSLDLEMVNAMAPGLTKMISYEGDPINSLPNDILSAIANDNAGRQVTCSWGWIGGPLVSTDQIIMQMVAQGMCFFDASGDSDSYPNGPGVGSVDDPNGPGQPADSPYMIHVGGTTLSTTGPLGSWVSETVWQDGGGVGSSGAISTHYPIPTWQAPVNMSANGGSSVFRDTPDVACAGDNIYVIADNGTPYAGIQGTSCAAPLWAAFDALINEKAVKTGSPNPGFLDPAIYAICLGPLYGECFHDITNGNDFSLNNPTEFSAVPGYDLASGWGTMTGQALINALVHGNGITPILAIATNNISGGNGSGTINPDGCVNLTVTITNVGTGPATDVQATLLSATSGVLIGQATVGYANIGTNSSAVNSPAFTVSTEPSFVCGTTVNLLLVIKCDQLTQTNVLQFTTGVVGPPTRFDNSTPLPIPANLAGAMSPILVSGINTVGKVTVSLNLTDAEDEFIELILTSPNGTSSFLALGDGGVGANFGTACAPDASRTTFDDAATASILNGAAPLQGSYMPETPLSVFNLMTGTNVNGMWELQVVNELEAAATLNCWSLFISPEQCADGGGECPGADLSVTMAANPITTPAGSPLTYTLSVSNAGPSPAPNTVVNLTLPPSFVYEGSSNSQGSAQSFGSSVTFTLGTVGIQSNATVVVSALTTTNGFFTATAVVGSPASDSNPDNNTATSAVLVTKPDADLDVTMTTLQPSVPVGGQAVFFVNITNNGPATALGVALTNFLPPNVNVTSAITSQGTVAPGGTLVSIGTLFPSNGATATLILSPTVAGAITLTSKSGLAPTETDPIVGNNSASVTVTVVPAADLGVSAVASPSPAISGVNYIYVVTVTNAGPATATAVVMNQTLPIGVTFVSTSQASATNTTGVVSWAVGTMPAGTSQVLTNTVRAPALLTGVASNVLVSTFGVFGQPTDPNTNNNVVTITTLDLRPMAVIVPVSATLTSESIQPATGAVKPGETVGVQFLLENNGNIPTTNLVVTLLNSGGVVPIAGFGTATYGALAPGGGTGVGQFMFSNTGTDGGTITAALQLQDGVTNLGTNYFTFVMPIVTTFWNNQIIFVPDTNDLVTGSGPANPDPSSNFVSGVTTFVSDVAVIVSNLNHSYPHDISMMVVGPGGQSSILMSAAAAQSAAVPPVTITFDEGGAGFVPTNSGLVNGGIYQPAAYNSPMFTNTSPAFTNVFHTNVYAASNANLSIFVGVPPNGAWNLYVYDGATGDAGAISNGWGLAFTTLTPVNKITDVGVTVGASTNAVTVGSSVTYTISVTNSGTNATTVFLTNVLSAGLSFASNTGSLLPYLQTGQTQYYNLGVLAGQTNVTFGFVANTTAAGSQTSTVSVGSSLIDPNLNNNLASATVTVSQPVADVAAAISASTGSNAVVVGSNIVYTLTVTNNGPQNAINVVGMLAQGTTGLSSVVFSNYFGGIAPGTIATALFTNAVGVAGILTNTWTVSTGSTDTVPGNNSAVQTVLLTYPEPVIAAGAVRLLSESLVPADGAISSNETVSVSFTLGNVGVAPTTNLVATLQAIDGVTPITASQSYGAIAPGSSSAQTFSFVARGLPGSTVTAVLSLTDGSYALGSVTFPFVLSTTLGYTNNSAIIIPQFGAASPYPAAIVVSTTNGVVGKVTATLVGFTHTFPSDVEAVLVGPAGQQVVLMGHVGSSFSVSNLTLVFDDASTNSLGGGPLVSGTNHPSALGEAGFLPSVSGAPSNTNLSAFIGSNPNGIWSLYVYDNSPGNSGSIINGWTLDLTLINPVNPPGSLAVSLTHSPNSVLTQNLLTYQLAVTNLGPTAATNVILTDTLPANSILASVTVSRGTVNTNVAGMITFSPGVLTNAGDTLTATIQVEPVLSGLALNSATATDAAGATASATDSATVVLLTPFFLQANVVSNNVILTLDGQLGQSYVLQVSSNLTSWTSVLTNTATGVGVFSITNSVTNSPDLFYRAIHLPQ